VIERIGTARIHGRYLIAPPVQSAPAPILAGFHGYGENAETQLERLCSIAGNDGWLKISIQGLHPFYERRTNRVVAGWMTRQNREPAIADNIEWVNSCLDAAAAEWGAIPRVVFTGFSQGVAMAFRAAAHSSRHVAGVIAVGGDIPPELTPSDLQRINRVILTRGLSDTWYSDQKFLADQARLRDAAVSFEIVEFNGEHEWPAAIFDLAHL
jgi:predicted esterase